MNEFDVRSPLLSGAIGVCRFRTDVQPVSKNVRSQPPEGSTRRSLLLRGAWALPALYVLAQAGSTLGQIMEPARQSNNHDDILVGHYDRGHLDVGPGHADIAHQDVAHEDGFMKGRRFDNRHIDEGRLSTQVSFRGHIDLARCQRAAVSR